MEGTTVAETSEQLLSRLRRIEGQVRGVQRMIQDGRDCPAILQQMSAVRAAMHQASLLLVRSYMNSCLADVDLGDRSKVVDRLVGLLDKMD